MATANAGPLSPRLPLIDPRTGLLTTEGFRFFQAIRQAVAVSGAIVDLNSPQTLTNKTMDADDNTFSNFRHGEEVDNPTSGVHGVVGTVVGTTDAQTLTNKTIDGDNNSLVDIDTSSLKTRTGLDGAVVTGTAGANTYFAQWNADGDIVGLSPAGALSLAGAQPLDATLTALAAFNTNGIIVQTAADTFVGRTLTATSPVQISNPAGTAGNPLISVDAATTVASGIVELATSAETITGTDTVRAVTPAGAAAAYQPLDADLTALAANATDGFWAHTGAGTGAARTLGAPAAGLTISNPAGIAGAPAFALANDLAALEALAGTDTIYRRSGVDTWTAVTYGTGVTLTGGAITLDTDLSTIAGLTATSDNFLQAKASAWASRTVAQVLVDLAAPGTTFQPLDATLTSLAAYNTNGILTQTAADTFTGRTITGTAAEITSTNGSGVSGNPTLSLPSALTFTSKTITGGTYVLTGSTQSSAPVRARTADVDQFEFGNSVSGYGSALGNLNVGNPYVAFHAFHGTNSNTFQTVGTTLGSVFMSDNGLGGFRWVTLSATTDNQSGTNVMTLSAAGGLSAISFMKPGSYTVGTVPSAATSGAGATIYVSNETGGAVLAFSDATNWRRVTDRSIIA
jgi:hypothetical protein